MDERSQAFLEAVRDLAASPALQFWFSVLDAGAAQPADRQQVIKNVGLATLTNQAGTVCDLNAYALLCAAVGIDEVEELKTKEHNDPKKHPRLIDGAKTANGHAHVFKAGQGKQLGSVFRAWSRGFKPGICQIKILGNSAHTFVFHRATTDALRLFQAYEGCYRLADFLSEGENEFLKSQGKAGKINYKVFETMRDFWGNYKCRSYIEVALRMIGSLSLALGGKDLSPASYGEMFGKKYNQAQEVTHVAMLAFEDLAPAAEIRANMKAILEDKMVGMSKWTDISDKSEDD